MADADHGLHVTLVVANTFQFDSRQLRTAGTLAADGHHVRILAWSGPDLPTEEVLPGGLRLTRITLDRRISSALRPLPGGIRRVICRVLGLDPEAVLLSPEPPRGIDRLRHPVRRLLEVVANARRVGPWADAVVAAAPETEVFHAKALIVLPVVREAARRLGGAFVYDVADYHTEAARLARMPGVVRELVRRRERDWARDAAGTLAVSEPIARLVQQRWGIAPPVILMNCPPAWHPETPGPVPSDLVHRTASIDGDRPVILYQGGYSVDRGIEELVTALDEPVLRDLRAVAVFMGFGRLEAFLRERAAATPDRVIVLPPVPPDELLPWTASADVTFVGQPPRTLNQRYNLPNKLFESLMAGVPVVVSADNEQCRLTSAEQVGVCVDIDSPSAIADGLARILGAPRVEQEALRQRCRTAALERYSWERNVAGLTGLYRDIAGGRSAQREAASRDRPPPGAAPR
ncbi:MAG: glycosyltransferase [Chloroflexi bacterium]|nr:glycosyltransferase [Chloroflexota bacterium]